MKIMNQGIIYIYKIDYGTLSDKYQYNGAIRSCLDALRLILGCVVVCQDHVFALQEHEEEEFSLPVAANGQQLIISFRKTYFFSLDQ
jgi:hypothetical protein